MTAAVPFTFGLITALTFLIAPPTQDQDQELTLAVVPPVVVQTIPEAGADDIDPATAEIRVRFSKPMQDRTWSWATSTQQSFPKITGEPRYIDESHQTCVLPVTLEPGKTYALWLNSQNHHNFKDTQGRPAIPYLLVFRTRD